MKTSTLFVVGLIVGALTVFCFRAVSTSSGDASADGKPSAPEPNPHAGHSMSAEPAPAPAPAPAPVPVPVDPGGQVDDDGRKPENQICPVMGNEVDPDLFVDYQGRRIGFCCPGCDERFLKDPEKYLKKVDAELAARKGGK